MEIFFSLFSFKFFGQNYGWRTRLHYILYRYVKIGKISHCVTEAIRLFPNIIPTGEIYGIIFKVLWSEFRLENQIALEIKEFLNNIDFQKYMYSNF